RIRESPVASEKIAVDQARRRPASRPSTWPSIGRASAVSGSRPGVFLAARPPHRAPWSSPRPRVGLLPTSLCGRAYRRNRRRSATALCRKRDDRGCRHGLPVWPPREARREAATGALLRSRGPRSGRFYVMPNIKQQKKRVRTATRERLENLRYRSTVKTLTKRLQSAVAEGDEERAAAEHRELVRAIDKATSRRALHRNTAARKKAQAARLLSGS
ncbi:MAG: 30S ribosomal protein S20, partial [Actinobacteria bacterium]